jgi:hypothetical protein
MTSKGTLCCNPNINSLFISLPTMHFHIILAFLDKGTEYGWGPPALS